eukprot:gene6905-biopygen16589
MLPGKRVRNIRQKGPGSILFAWGIPGNFPSAEWCATPHSSRAGSALVQRRALRDPVPRDGGGGWCADSRGRDALQRAGRVEVLQAHADAEEVSQPRVDEGLVDEPGLGRPCRPFGDCVQTFLRPPRIQPPFEDCGRPPELQRLHPVPADEVAAVDVHPRLQGHRDRLLRRLHVLAARPLGSGARFAGLRRRTAPDRRRAALCALRLCGATTFATASQSLVTQLFAHAGATIVVVQLHLGVNWIRRPGPGLSPRPPLLSLAASACCKHYVANSMEDSRVAGVHHTRYSADPNITDQDLVDSYHAR